MRKKKTPTTYVADFETTSYAQYIRDGYTKVYLWEILSLDDNNKYVGIDMSTFFQTIDDKIENGARIYFHNLSGFDAEFIIPYLMTHGFTYITGNEELYQNQFTSITTDMTSHYLIRVKTNKVEVEFRCSYRLFPITIKQMGKFVGIPKLDETHDYKEYKDYKTIEDVTDEEWKYLHNDCDILRNGIIALYNLGIDDITMSTSAFKSWKKSNYLDYRGNCIKSSEEVEKIINLSYKGGITMANPLYAGQILYNLKSYDYNSMYPSQMELNEMPCGEGLLIKCDKNNWIDIRNNLNNCNHRLKLYEIVIESIEIEKGAVPFIGITSGFSFSGSYKYEKRLSGRRIVLWEREFDLMLKWYIGNFQVISVVGFESRKNVFKRYIDIWREVKETTKDEATRKLAKLMLNSLYGKFGMKSERIAKFPNGFDENGRVIYDSYDARSEKYYYRARASYITSLARCELIEAIEEIGEKGFIYCDTDSVYCFEECMPNIKIDDVKFGHWKCEGHYEKAKFLKAKLYIKYENGNKVVRSAGLPNDVAQEVLDFDTLKNGFKIEGKKKVKKRVRGGVVICETDFTIKVDDLTTEDLESES